MLGVALGTDLSSVRIHDGAASNEAAKAISARAYTEGKDIHFGAGQFAPETEAGRHLLAHEVAHTVQQEGATAGRQSKPIISAPGDAHEQEADAFADAFVRGDTPPPVARSSRATVSRKPNNTYRPPPVDAPPTSAPGGNIGSEGTKDLEAKEGNKPSEQDDQETNKPTKDEAAGAAALCVSVDDFRKMKSIIGNAALVAEVSAKLDVEDTTKAKATLDTATKQKKIPKDGMIISIPIDKKLLTYQGYEFQLQLMIRALDVALPKYGVKRTRGDYRRMLESLGFKHDMGYGQLRAHAEYAVKTGTPMQYNLRMIGKFLSDWNSLVQRRVQAWREFRKQLKSSTYAVDAIKSFYIAHANGAINIVNGAMKIVTAGQGPQIPKIGYVGEYGRKYGATMETGATIGVGGVGIGLASKAGAVLGPAVGGLEISGVAVGPHLLGLTQAYLAGSALNEVHSLAQAVAADLLMLATGDVEKRVKNKRGEVVTVTVEATPEELAAARERVFLAAASIGAGVVVAKAFGGGGGPGGDVSAQGGKAGLGNSKLPDARVVGKPGGSTSKSKSKKTTTKPSSVIPPEVMEVIGKKIGSVKKAPPGTEFYRVDGQKRIRWKKNEKSDKPSLGVDLDGRIKLGVDSLNRAQLGKRMRAAGGRKYKNHEDHHVVPIEVARDHRLFQLARNKGKPKWDPNDASNGIQLPKTKRARRNVKASRDMPLHSGSHPKYTAKVKAYAERELNILKSKYGKLSKIPPSELTAAAKRVQAYARGLVKRTKGELQ